jgi:transposase|nr:IS110 family transposase [Serratia proteamaculans]
MAEMDAVVKEGEDHLIAYESKLGRITKAGDVYLSTLLVQGTRSVMIGADNRMNSLSRWVCSLISRRGYWCAVVAIAAKNARLCWA